MTLKEALESVMRWLKKPQLRGAMVSQHGTYTHVEDKELGHSFAIQVCPERRHHTASGAPDGVLWICLGAEDLWLPAMNRHHPERIEGPFPTELVDPVIESFGKVWTRWDCARQCHPGRSYVIQAPAHPSHYKARQRYVVGCRRHPDKGGFCDCYRWLHGFDLYRKPEGW